MTTNWPRVLLPWVAVALVSFCGGVWFFFQVGLWFAGREGGFEWSNYWFGELGALGVLLSTGTFVAAVAGAVGVIWTIRHNAEALATSRDAERSGRFQKGAEMLMEPDSEAPMAGVVLTLQAAQEDPGRYYAASVVLLAGSINQMSGPLAAEARQAHPDAWPHTPLRVAFALAGLGNALAARRGVLQQDPTATIDPMLNTDGRFALEKIYLCRRIVAIGSSLADVISFDVLLHQVAFNRVSFANSLWRATAGFAIVFDGCDMDRSDLTIVPATMRQHPLAPTDTGVVRFQNVRNADSATINGMSLSRWIELSEQA